MERRAFLASGIALVGGAQPAGRNPRTIAILLSALFLLAVTDAEPSAAQDGYAAQRARMVAQIAAMARETGGAMGRPRFSEAVMTAMGRVPRHRFVPVRYEGVAYENRPLPIGEGQTISQPFLVALMTDVLDPKRGDIVLEVGTGSSYQAAVLAELVAKVYTIEIVEPLGRWAMQLLGQAADRPAQARRPHGDPRGWIGRLAVSAACGKAPRWHPHDEAYAAGEVRAVHRERGSK